MPQWLEIQSSQIENLKNAAERYHIHPLAIEDCIHRDQRPKLEDFEGHQFLVWFMMAAGKLYEIQFIILPDILFMIPHELPPEGNSWKDYLKIGDNHKDVWHLLYHALDRATDETWNEMKRFFSEINDFEEQIFRTDCEPESILELKKQLNKVDYSIGHLPSVAKQLQNFYRPKDDLSWKLRDLHDHCDRIYHSLALYRSQVATTIDLFWGYQAHRMNRDLKKLSVLASIAVPLTFWASFWGMNFEAIPFKSENLFIIAVGVMILSVLFTAWLLVRRGYWED